MKYSFTKISVSLLIVVLFAGAFFVFQTKGGTTLGVTLKTNPDLERGLVGHWTFDGANPGVDVSGNGNNGKLSGVSTTSAVTAGKIGQAFQFDGNDQHVSILDDSSLDVTTEASWAYWVNPTDTGTSHSTITKYTAGQLSFISRIEPDGTVRQYLYSSGDANQQTTTSLIFGEWTHVTVTYNSGTAKIFFNGVEQNSNENGTLPVSINNSTSPIRLGVYSNGPFVNDLSGSLDDVRMYNRELSPEEVKRLYDLGATSYIAKTITPPATGGINDLTAGLVGHWTFDGPDITGQGGVGIVDRSGQGNHGQFIGNATTSAAVKGKIGQAFEFDGSDDYVALGFVPVTGSNPRTVTMWVKPDSFVGTNTFIAWGTIGAGNKWTFRLNDQSANPRIEIEGAFHTTSLSLTISQWNFVAVTFNGSTIGDHILYLDNVSENASGANAVNTLTDINATIGDSLVDGGGRAFNGSIDDVRIYNRALSAEEIKRLYDLGATSYIAKTIEPPKTGGTNDLTAGLVGHWTFDGPDITDDLIVDTSGQGNHGGFFGGATTSAAVKGKIGQAFEFDGSDDYVNVGTNISLANKNFTVTVWAKRASFGTEDFIFSIGENTGVSNKVLHIGYRPSNVFTCAFWADDIDTVATYTDSDWHHWVCAYDVSTKARKIYRDGIFVIEDVATGDFSGATQSIIIGDLPQSGSAAEFDGNLDDFRIYNRTLSADEITRLYDLGR